MKRLQLFLIIIFTFIFLSGGCSYKGDELPVISSKTDSKYEDTFQELNLGVLFDFDMYLPNADKSWVRFWVERYDEGIKDTNPLLELSYGNFPSEIVDGRLGFGMINPNTEKPFMFLYGHGIKSQPELFEQVFKESFHSTWSAIDTDKVRLELGETKILAAYRQNESFRTVDLLDEASVTEMIESDSMVLLLKIKVDRID